MGKKRIRKSCMILLALVMSLTEIMVGTTIVYADVSEVIVDGEAELSESDTLVNLVDEVGTDEAVESETIENEIVDELILAEDTSEDEEAVDFETSNSTSIDEEDEITCDTVSSGNGTVAFSTQGSETTASLSEGAAGIKAEKDETTGVTSITISAPGEYSLTGEAVNTYITVAKGLSDGVILNLDSLTIDDSSLCAVTGKDLPVIAVKKSGSVVTLNLIGGSSLKGSSSYAEDPEALIKAPESTLTIQGSGTLNIANTPDDAVKAKNGTINILSGKINIVDEIYGDGIQAENVNISGGEINIATVFNNAATGYYTSGSNVAGMNTITEDERSGLKTERINVNLGDHAGIKVGTKESTRIYKDLQSSDSDNATETYDASGSLNISGGTINIDTTGAGLKANGGVSGYTACSNGVYIIGAPDDAIKSNNDISITGGTITINSSDDGISAANNLTVSGSETKIDINDSFEGIEGSKIIFGTAGETTGPVVTINSKDDGINAAHKSNVTYTYDSSEDEDCNYTKTTTKTAGNSCTVYSGTVTVKIDSLTTKNVTLRDGSKSSTKTVSYRADGDGIDCNGTLNLEGGTTYVFGASPSTSNSPIDTDSGFTLGSGATVLAVGSDGMNESTPRSGSGVYFTYGSGMSGGPGGVDGPGGTEGPGGPKGPGENQTATIAAGSIFKVTSGTTTIIEEELPYAASFLLYGSPAISGTTGYTATLNETIIKTSESTPSEKDHVHYYTQTEYKAPTCTKSGSRTYTCSCRDFYMEELPALGHDYKSEVTKEPTTMAEGVRTFTCTRCGDKYTEAIEKLNGSFLMYEKDKSGEKQCITKKLNVGAGFTLMPKFESGKVVNERVVWASTNPNVATVTQDGKVKAVSGGETKIIVKSEENPDLSAYCYVTVAEPVSEVTLDNKKVSFGTGESATVTASVLPFTAKQELKWTASNENVKITTAKDTLSAVIMGIAAGSSKITVEATDGSGKKVTCSVTVGNPVPEFKIAGKGSKSEVMAGKTLPMQVDWGSTKPKNAAVTWNVEGTNANYIASINDKGVLTGITAGKVTVTATSVANPNKKASTEITVTKPAESRKPKVTAISFKNTKDLTEKGLCAGKSFTIKTDLTLAAKGSADSNAVAWISSDPTVATVSQKGAVKAVRDGSVTITAITRDATDINTAPQAEVTFKVYSVVKSVKIDKRKLTIGTQAGTEYGKVSIASVIPDFATNPSMDWTVNGENVQLAAVLRDASPSTGVFAKAGEKVTTKGGDEAVAIKAVTPGVVKLTGITKDGSNKKVTCTITVRGEVTGLTLKTQTAKNGINDMTQGTVSGNNVTYKSTMKESGSLKLTPVFEINGVSNTQSTKKTYNVYKKYTDLSVSYRSSDTAVATVDKNGKIKIQKKASGKTATIYGVTADGQRLVEVLVTVK